ncbi:FixH family protein [Bacillus sp. M6-12]|uniref:FixH family protein n=1 Tax=Bacillus sp. M6-12 TaxID=2054166 RepID=UPI0015E0BB2F|nr:FixH family protein [Bacillus sp. M6-12]
MKQIILILISLIFVMAGCSKDEKPAENDKVPELIDVVIKMPETLKANVSVNIQAAVTQGNEKVDDADEVKFEIGKAGQEDTEMIPAKHQGKGVYAIKYTFTEDGKYTVVAHVTARSMHNMPKKEISVGTGGNTAAGKQIQQSQNTGHSHGDEGTQQPQGNDSTEHSHGNESSEHSYGHAHGNTAIDFQAGTSINANEEAVLTASIQNGGQPLTGADVRFEIWQEEHEPHEFLPAQEGENGKYSLNKTFTAQGVYTIKIHLEKGEIHDHLEEKIDVK